MQIGSFSLEECKAVMNKPIEKGEFLTAFEFALYAQRYVNFWIGDIGRIGEARFGESFYQSIGIDLSPDLISRCIAVATKVPPSVRVPSLTWSHHREVTNLTPLAMKAALEGMERHGIGSGEARNYVRQFKRGQGCG